MDRENNPTMSSIDFISEGNKSIFDKKITCCVTMSKSHNRVKKIEKTLFDTLEHYTRNTILILRYKLVKAGIPKPVVVFFLIRAERILKPIGLLTLSYEQLSHMIFSRKKVCPA